MTSRYIEWLLETEADETVINAAIQEYRKEFYAATEENKNNKET